MREDADSQWNWVVCGRYDYYAVDKYLIGDSSNSTYGDSLIFRTRKDATRVANAMNAAWQAGRDYGRKNAGAESLETAAR